MVDAERKLTAISSCYFAVAAIGLLLMLVLTILYGETVP